MILEKVQLKQPLIVGISGKAGSGKDTFADLLISDYGATKIPFAKAVKDEVEEFLMSYSVGYTRENLWGNQHDKEQIFFLPIEHVKEINKTDIQLYDLLRRFGTIIHTGIRMSFRTLLQIWGTEYRRAQDKDYWVIKAFSQCKDKKIYVLSDVRFQNEYDAITKPHPLFNGFSVRINGRQSNISGMEHPSETGLDHIIDWDYTIINDRSYNEYLTDCRIIINDILKRLK